MVLLPLLYVCEPLRANYEVYGPRQHIRSYEYYPEDERVAPVVPVEHYDPLHVEEERAHEEEGDDDLEDGDEEEDVLEGLVLVGRQGDRVDEVDDHNEDEGGDHEDLDLPLQEGVVVPMDEDKQVVHPRRSQLQGGRVTISSRAGRSR